MNREKSSAVFCSKVAENWTGLTAEGRCRVREVLVRWGYIQPVNVPMGIV